MHLLFTDHKRHTSAVYDFGNDYDGAMRLMGFFIGGNRLCSKAGVDTSHLDLRTIADDDARRLIGESDHKDERLTSEVGNAIVTRVNYKEG